MLTRLMDLMLGAVGRAAMLVADDDYRLVLTPRFGGLIPAEPDWRPNLPS
jgi:hypothetical protein